MGFAFDPCRTQPVDANGRLSSKQGEGEAGKRDIVAIVPHGLSCASAIEAWPCCGTRQFESEQPIRISLVVAGTITCRRQHMTRPTLLAATLLLLASVPAGAQSQPAQSGPGNNAVNSSDQNNSNKPVEGRNSFTEGQAKSRIEGAGYSNVSGLQKDDQGVWRGKADKAGTKTDVSLDFQGNVNPTK